jgi:hypothetical protein
MTKKKTSSNNTRTPLHPGTRRHKYYYDVLFSRGERATLAGGRFSISRSITLLL